MSVLAALSSVNVYIVYLDDFHIGYICMHNHVDPCWINSSSLHNVLCAFKFTSEAVLCCDKVPPLLFWLQCASIFISYFVCVFTGKAISSRHHTVGSCFVTYSASF